MADLISLSDCLAALPSLTADQKSILPAVISAASRAIERFCDRTLALADFDRTYYPERNRVVRLGQYPVRTISRVSAGAVPALGITNTNAIASTRATVEVVTTGDPPDLTPTGITLRSTTSGVVASPVTLTFASYPTFGDLAAAVSTQGGGWSATTQGDRGSDATALILADAGARQCAGGAYSYLYMAAAELTEYDADLARGVLTFGIGWPFFASGGGVGNDVYRYPDKRFGLAPKLGGVRVNFTAGYSTIPDDVQQAALFTVKAMLDLTPFPGTFTMERTDNYTYQMTPTVTPVPPPAQALLRPYRRLTAV